MSKHTLFFATTNKAKLAQLRWVAAHLGCDVRIISASTQFGDAARYEEIGQSELEIARRGAQDVARRLGVPVLTEDSGFHVAALKGQPGIRAGSYLKKHGRQRLLRQLSGISQREAVIISAIAYATPEIFTSEQRVSGTITDQERWLPGLPNWIAPTQTSSLGGGYNAILVPHGETRTLAEIPPSEALTKGYREPNFVALLKRLGYV